MIFVTVGSQKFQFNRLLQKIDELIENKKIKSEEVFAQIGYSTYEPRFYTHVKFLNNEEFLEKIDKCEIMITHGGTGSLINGVKKRKRVIGVPRTVEYGEHVDNHQFDIIEQFAESNLILGISNMNELESVLEKVENIVFREYKSNTANIINLLDEYLLEVKK